MNAQLFAKAERQLRVVREDMEKLKGEGEEGGVGEVVAGLATAMLTLRSLEDSLSRETAMEKRQQGKQAEHQSLKEALEKVRVKQKESERISTRAALLTPSPGAVQPTMTETILQEREDNTLRYASNRVEEYISIGTGTLESLRNQKSALKSAQRRVLDAGTRLGLSQSVMKVISRRTAQDRYIFYAGVAATFFVIYLCWRYL